MNITNPDQIKSAFESGARGTNQPSIGPDGNPIFATPPSQKGPSETHFEKALQDTIARVNDTQTAADRAVARMASGQEANIHNTMLQLEQADISLRLAMQVRAKALDAYHEIMRMQMG